jgi:AbrB family looped-hinge helix DNA binding protein
VPGGHPPEHAGTPFSLKNNSNHMKKYPKLVQADSRGQIVIPKDVRNALDIDENTGFYMYVIPGEGVFLQQVEPEPLETTTQKLQENAKKIGLNKDNLQKATQHYNTKGGLQEL